MQARYLTTSSTQSDFTTATPVLANGRRVDMTAHSDGQSLLIAGNANWRVVPLGNKCGTRMQLFGSGADNATINAFRVWGVSAYVASGTVLSRQPAPGEIIAIELFHVGQGTATLSAAVGASSSDLLSTSERLADTITWATATSATTPSGPQTQIEANIPIGYCAAYSPAGDAPALLDLPCIGHPNATWGWLIEFDVGTATAANAIYENY